MGPASSSTWFAETLAALMDRRDLGFDEVRDLVHHIIAGRCDDVETAALLVALRMKGETRRGARRRRRRAARAMIPLETGRDDVLDTCGTGGDGSGTFNISTAAAFVVAGAGVPVVKHGNRAVSSASGSADVLTALGIVARPEPTWIRRCLDETGLAFCFAPHFHPALHQVANLRHRLRVRTLFNLLGPLANPARAKHQLLGVARPVLLEPLAGALARLGTRRALLVCGLDGLDEVSLSGPTLVADVEGPNVTAREWTPEDFGLARCPLAALRAEGAHESAAMIRSALEPEDSPAGRIVLANAGAALIAAGRAQAPMQGTEIAREAVASGRARRVLEELTKLSRSP